MQEQAQGIFEYMSKNAIEKKTLKEFIHIKHGFAFKGEFISTDDNGVVLVTPGNFCIGGGFKEAKCKYYTGEIPENYILEPNSLIVTMTDLSKAADTLGYGALIPLNKKRLYLHNQRIGLVQMISEKLPKDYIYWFLRSYEYQKNIINSATGSTVKHTSPERICMQEIPIPLDEDVEKYERIFIDIDFQIAKNNLQIQELEDLRDALLPKLMSGEQDVSDIDI